MTGVQTCALPICRAVAIAQLVLWIGFFQWQRRTTGKADTNERPLLPKEATILHQDVVLAYDATIARKDPITGAEITIWDGHTTKPHPVTGKPVPDESPAAPSSTTPTPAAPPGRKPMLLWGIRHSSEPPA